MKQLKDQAHVEHEQESTIEQTAQARLLTAEEVKAVAGGPPIVNM